LQITQYETFNTSVLISVPSAISVPFENYMVCHSEHICTYDCPTKPLQPHLMLATISITPSSST